MSGSFQGYSISWDGSMRPSSHDMWDPHTLWEAGLIRPSLMILFPFQGK